MKNRPQGASVCRALTPRSRPAYQEIPPLVTRPTTSRPWLHLITGREAIRGLLEGPGADQACARLAYEALALFRQAPDALGSALRRLRRGEVSLPLTDTARGIAGLETHLDRAGNRLSLAMVSLGLHVAGSLLMQHSLGPRIWGGLPLLAVLAYGLALWFTWRLARGISRSGRL